jgi:hypothetical protein
MQSVPGDVGDEKCFLTRRLADSQQSQTWFRATILPSSITSIAHLCRGDGLTGSASAAFLRCI